MTAIMRASGGLSPCVSGRSWVAELQLAPSTHMTLGRAIGMNDLRSMVRHYVSQLANSDAEDACHFLLELGPVALPHIHEAFRLTHNGVVQVRLAQVACHSRS